MPSVDARAHLGIQTASNRPSASAFGNDRPYLDLARAVANGFRFRLNQLVYGSILPVFYRIETGLVSKGGLLNEVQVMTRQGAGCLPFYVVRDENGLWRGGQPGWKHLRGLTFSSHGAADILNRHLIGQLPANVSFLFVFVADLADAEPVKTAFKSAGFRLREMETYICVPQAGSQDTIDTLTGRSIKGTLRRARRDLELVDLTVDDFFSFHEENLFALGRTSYRDSISDRMTLTECKAAGRARILGARRKTGPNQTAAPPLDAALACLWDKEDGVYKLWRTTYRRGSCMQEAPKPHPDASKLLTLAAIEDARARKLILDTDGSAPGTEHYYGLFGPGFFQRTIRLQCEHETVWSIINRYYPSVFKRPQRGGHLNHA
jgi:hypothetical protein